MNIENRVELIELYDLYFELLTDKQKQYFEEYYFDDLEGCKVTVKGNHIGKVSKVEDYNGRRSLRVTLSNKKQILMNTKYYLFRKYFR